MSDDTATGATFDATVLDQLFQTIEGRKGGDPTQSHTAQLFRKGTGKIAQKVGEEAVETVLAASGGKKEEIVKESADLLFHLLVLWAQHHITPQDVFSELKRREGVSGLTEKASRS